MYKFVNPLIQNVFKTKKTLDFTQISSIQCFIIIRNKISLNYYLQKKSIYQNPVDPSSYIN